MLRLVLLLLYLAASYSTGQTKAGRNLDPNGLVPAMPPAADIGGGLDPDGLAADNGRNLDPDGLTAEPPAADSGRNLDPNG